ncbi:MAG: ACT domain-containing protein [Ruminococcus sp.]|jgi:ACT domain-containing protein|nr:ACT domain-containing protein [Ruminococcus sp.]
MEKTTVKAVITVIGKDTIGILAKVSTLCSKHGANVIEVTQSVLQDLFAMIMLVDVSALNIEFSQLSDKLKQLGSSESLTINIINSEVFEAMHNV